MKVLSLFSGIGAFEKALDNLGIPYELVGFSEIDKYAVKSYCAIHGVDESMNLGDITKIDAKQLPKDIGLITYGFPCQDISLAGKQKGLFNDDGTQTRSGLFFEALRIIEETQPIVAIAENVKNLTSKKFSEQFKIVMDSLYEAGYNNYWKVLNAKDYGIPQNRERVFIISIRKDIDKGYEFPEGFPLELRLKDLLEDEVDEKFYLKGTGDFFIKNSFEQEARGNGFRFEPHVKNNADVSKAITTRAGGRMDDNFIIDIESDESTFKFDSTNKMIQVGQIYGTNREPNPQAGRIYSADGISPTMDTCSGGNRMPKVLVREATKKGYAEAVEPVCLNSKGGRGGVDGLQPSLQDRVYDSDAISTAVTTSYMPNFTHGSRIRKLTPKECFRLMGFDDADFEKAEAVNSNTQLYKQAGNSIVVDVLEAIFTNLKPYLSEREVKK